MSPRQGRIVPSEREEAKDIIRAVFKEIGHVSTRELWQAAKERLPKTLRESLETQGGINLVREALTEEDENGLPFAQPTGNEDGQWQQLALFDYDELHALIVRRDRATVADYRKTERLVDYCFQKFGKAPRISQLIVPENKLAM